jgi:NAD(P)-dependent dehydrogenase (short-subunit alcohol dehydrogenase family)
MDCNRIGGRVNDNSAQHFQGKFAIVTGASKGIGLGVARHLASAGAALAICSRTADELEQAARELRSLGARVFHQPCDVADKAAMRAFVDATHEEFGAIDILINNAAYMMRPEPLDGFDDAVYENCIAVSLNSVFYMMKYTYPYMKQRGGKIVNFASLAGLRGGKNLAGYAAAKMGVVGLTRVAATEWAKHRINVNCVAPIAMSDVWQQVMNHHPKDADPFEAIALRRNTLGYPGDTERDIAPAVAFLCSEAAAFITGHVLPVDGGLLELET